MCCTWEVGGWGRVPFSRIGVEYHFQEHNMMSGAHEYVLVHHVLHIMRWRAAHNVFGVCQEQHSMCISSEHNVFGVRLSRAARHVLCSAHIMCTAALHNFNDIMCCTFYEGQQLYEGNMIMCGKWITNGNVIMKSMSSCAAQISCRKPQSAVRDSHSSQNQYHHVLHIICECDNVRKVTHERHFVAFEMSPGRWTAEQKPFVIQFLQFCNWITNGTLWLSRFYSCTLCEAKSTVRDSISTAHCFRIRILNHERHFVAFEMSSRTCVIRSTLCEAKSAFRDSISAAHDFR